VVEIGKFDWNIKVLQSNYAIISNPVTKYKYLVTGFESKVSKRRIPLIAWVTRFPFVKTYPSFVTLSGGKIKIKLW